MKSDDVYSLENAGWPVLLARIDGEIVRANLAAQKVFGPTIETPERHLSLIWTENSGGNPENFLIRWESAPSPMVPLSLRVQDGTSRSFISSICTLERDGRKLFLMQLFPDTSPADLGTAHKQKLDCALQLAKTVSLDFNNALTSILGHTSLLLSNIEPDHPWRSSLLEVEKSAEKAAEIANDLGAFSLQEKETKASATGNLNTIVQRAAELFRNSTGKRIAWNLHLERKLFAANFDEAKMLQALSKILENAVESVGVEGRINILSRGLELAEASQDRNVKLAPGTYVCVEIGDSGCGIETDVLPRIFEPFFTTKQSPHRGLGLALVYGIVTNHGGGVAVSSQPGVGTSVRVYLPSEKYFVQSSTPDDRDLKGTGTILMVDDEALMLNLGETVLSAYGYQVLTANSGAKALEILSRKGTHVDLVITDLVMPMMSGRELVERIQQLSPSTPIICTSGFVRTATQVDEAYFLQKPFTSQQLLAKVKQAFAVELGHVD